MIHHAIRCFICCCISATGGGNSSQENAQFNVAKASVPDFFLTMKSASKESFILLYIFVKIRHRLPHANEVFRQKKLGEWTVKIRKYQLNNQLLEEQMQALRLIPGWPIEKPAVETQPLLQSSTAAARPPMATSAAPRSVANNGKAAQGSLPPSAQVPDNAPPPYEA